mmetsp:Transcript_26054/g.21950  ORF Transcript_26054/g.21950 Transcript_26054/m.21950 type:complete len:81 (+) Transcript_26054:142-384(+)
MSRPTACMCLDLCIYTRHLQSIPGRHLQPSLYPNLPGIYSQVQAGQITETQTVHLVASNSEPPLSATAAGSRNIYICCRR